MKLTHLLSALFLFAAVLTPPAPAADGDPFVYFGTYTKKDGSKGIYRSTLDLATGKLSAPELAAEIESPSFVAIHPNKPLLYAVGEVGTDPAETKALNAFAIDPKTGALRHLNAQSTGGGAACHVSVDPSGKVALAANYSGGSVTSAPIKDDGSLGEPASFIQHVGSSVIPKRQAAPHAHSINVSPDGKWALVADLGLDQILIYKLDPASGKLTPNDPPFAGTIKGGGPRHLSFHPSGKFVFSNNEITSSVTAYTFDSKSGTLSAIETESTLPAEHKGNSTAECLVHPSGKFLYVSNRGHNTIAVYAIDQESGKLDLIENESTGGKIPRGFGIDPTGAYLIAANQQSHDVFVFRIDQKSGALDPTGQSVTVHSPVNVRFLFPRPSNLLFGLGQVKNPKENRENSNWLTRSGIQKHLEVHSLLGCPASFLLFALTVALAFLTKQPFIVIPAAIVVAFFGARLRNRIFFNKIRCPKCRFNPTRRRSDGEPREDYYKVLSQLSRYTECPNCGDRGDREFPCDRPPETFG